MLDEFSELVAKLVEKLCDAKVNFTKEQKAEFIQVLKDNNISQNVISWICEIWNEEEFIEQELFILGKQHVDIYSEDQVVDAIIKKYPVNNGAYLYYRGYIQGIRAERARRKKPVNEVKQSIHAMVDAIHTQDKLIRIHRFIQVIYIHKKVGEVAESTNGNQEIESTYEEILQHKIMIEVNQIQDERSLRCVLAYTKGMQK